MSRFPRSSLFYFALVVVLGLVFWFVYQSLQGNQNQNDWSYSALVNNIQDGKVKTIAAMKILDAQLATSPFVAGDTLSMGDIPVALMAYRFRRLVPERPPLEHLERWFAAIEQRPAFKEHVLAIPFV